MLGSGFDSTLELDDLGLTLSAVDDFCDVSVDGRRAIGSMLYTSFDQLRVFKIRHEAYIFNGFIGR